MTSYFGAALKGIGDGGTMLARSMTEENARQQRWDDQLRNQRELELLRQQGRLDVAEARQAGGGSRSGGKGGGVMDLGSGQNEELMAAQMGMSVPEYRQFTEMERTGSDKKYRTEGTVLDDEYGEQKYSALPPDFEKFKADKRAQRAKLMETYTFSDDIDKIAKSRGEDQKTKLVGEAAEGNREAGKGVLYSMGKDPVETESKAGKADAQGREADAKAGLARDRGELADRTDPNARKGGGGRSGGGAVSAGAAARLSSAERNAQIRSMTSELTNLQSGLKDRSRAQAETDQVRINMLRESLDNLRKASGEAAPGAAKATPSGAAPYPDGTRLRGKDGKTYVVRGGRPVAE